MESLPIRTNRITRTIRPARVPALAARPARALLGSVTPDPTLIPNGSAINPISVTKDNVATKSNQKKNENKYP